MLVTTQSRFFSNSKIGLFTYTLTFLYFLKLPLLLEKTVKIAKTSFLYEAGIDAQEWAG
jgi:hypothetical protein